MMMTLITNVVSNLATKRLFRGKKTTFFARGRTSEPLDRQSADRKGRPRPTPPVRVAWSGFLSKRGSVDMGFCTSTAAYSFEHVWAAGVEASHVCANFSQQCF